jgi:hypothetical protein
MKKKKSLDIIAKRTEIFGNKMKNFSLYKLQQIKETEDKIINDPLNNESSQNNNKRLTYKDLEKIKILLKEDTK